MKAVLISIQPKWVEKIANGEKKIEVRKTCPKIETPFKVYIYCTNDKRDYLIREREHYCLTDKYYSKEQPCFNGKVIGEFICDKITDHCLTGCSKQKDIEETLKGTCLNWFEYIEYQDSRRVRKCTNRMYHWHISDLVIYDEPKELIEFRAVKTVRGYHKEGESKIERLQHADRVEVNNITRPPQSWCYVEEL